MKKNFYSKIILTILLVAGGFFSLAHAAHADYYPMGTALSTNLLSGKADVAQITFFKAVATVPVNTTLAVQYSQDGANFFDHNYIAGGWDTLAAGTNTIDLGVFNWTTANFYYRVRFTTTDPATSSALTQAEVDYSNTYTPWTPPWGTGYAAAGTTVSADLLSGLGTQFQNGAYFAYKIATLPAGTVVTAQFSTDGENWFSSAGTAWMADTLSLGDHTTKPSALSLAALNWSGASSFYYKLNFSTTNSANSAAVTAAGLLFDNVQLGGSAIITTPPVASYDFNEGYGGTAHNGGLGGSSLDGTLQSGGSGGNATNSAMWDKGGRLGGGMEFDGTNDYVSISNIPTGFIGSGDFSISTWVNINVNNTGVIYSLGSYTDGVMLYLFSDGKMYLWVANGYTSYSWVPQIGSWYHIVVARSSGIVKTYINGAPLNTGVSLVNSINATEGMRIGYGFSGSANHYLNGKVDNTKIFNYALTSDQVKTLYNNNSAMSIGNDASRNDNGTTVTGAAKDYCIPGDTSKCDAPVGEWKFDTGSGTTAYDTSGNGNNGTWNGTGTHWTQGKLGKAGSFNGSDDYVDAGMDSSIQFDAGNYSFSVAAWVKPNNITGHNGTIIGQWGDTIANRGWTLVVLTDGSVKWEYSKSSASYPAAQSSASSVQVGNWYYVVGVKDGSRMNLYINGVLADTDNSQDGVIKDVYAHTKIGYGGVSDYFNGKIDDVKIYNYARTPAQIAWDYNHGGPVAEWRMDECSGTTIHDESGNGNTGTLNLGSSGQTSAGTCTDNANTAWYNGRNGKVNASLNFDGTDDYAYKASPAFNTGTSPRSISGWIKPSASATVRVPLAYGKNGVAGANFGFYLDTSNILHFWGAGGADFSTGATVPSGSWSHITVTYDGTNVIVYLNGTQVGPTTARTLLSGTDYLEIGGANLLDNGNYYYPGQIDDVKVFNYALTADQVKNEYNGGAVSFGQ